jgi:glutamyl-tRNA synthetase
MLMRIEDLDGDRVREEFASAALRDLEWLGLDWDAEVYVQSQGIERLNAAVQQLLASGAAYACTCTRGDIRNAQSAPQQGINEVRYPGTCRGRYASVAEAERASGRSAGIRLRVPAGNVELHDGFAGAHTSDVAAEIGDFLIARRDKAPAYQLAVVVDDAAQGVTEVLRGADLLSSAARQWHVQTQLGLPHPKWFHVPLVTDEAGRRFAKRSDDLSLAELRARGVDPRALVGWVAKHSGMATTETATAREFIASFDLERVPKQDVRVTLADIRSFGGVS